MVTLMLDGMRAKVDEHRMNVGRDCIHCIAMVMSRLGIASWIGGCLSGQVARWRHESIRSETMPDPD